MPGIHLKQQRLRTLVIALVAVMTLALGLFVPTPLAPQWHWFWCYFASVNLVTWLVFVYDKRIAGKPGVVRVPENTLFLLAVAGGLPSTLLAMQVVNHKRSKAAFKWKLFAWFVLVYASLSLVVWFFFNRLNLPV